MMCQTLRTVVPVSLFISLTVLVGATRGQAPNRVELAKTAKASVVLLEIRPNWFATAFCVHVSGMFVTQATPLKNLQAGTEPTVILPGSGKEPLRLKAKILRTDNDVDAALLQTEKPTKVPAVTLGNDDAINELAEVVAAGFPFGTPFTEKDELPSVNISLATVNSLRKKDNQLHRLMLDAHFLPGHAGGPLLDSGGKLIGMALSGGFGGKTSQAVPVSRLQRFLNKPEISLSTPVIRAQDSKPAEFMLGLTAVLPNAAPLEAKLTLKVEGLADRTFGFRQQEQQPPGGRADPRLIAAINDVLPAPTPKPVVRLLVQFAGGMVKGSLPDQEFKVGKEAVRVSQVRTLRGTPTSQVLLRDGRSLEGPITGLDGINFKVGDQEVTLKLAQATEVRFDPPPVPQSVEYLVIVTQEGKEVGRLQGSIPIEGAAPAAPLTADLRPAALEGLKAERMLPGPITDAVVAGGGRFLILHMAKLKRLAIFDTAEAKVVHYLTLAEENVLFAAGMEHLILVYPDQGIIQRYSLSTFEREVTATLPALAGQARVRAIVMGSASYGPLLLSATEPNHRGESLFLDPVSFRTLELKPAADRTNFHGGDRSFIRAAANGKVFGMWRADVSPQGLQTLTVSDKTYSSLYDHTSVGHVIPGPDGRYVYTARGVYTSQLKPLSTHQPNAISYTLPAVQGNLYLVVNPLVESKPAGVSVFVAGTSRPLISLNDIELPSGITTWDRESFSFDRRIFLIPEAKLLVTVAGTGDKLVLHRFDLDELLRKSGIDYLLVTSQPPIRIKKGSTYNYQLEVKSKKGDVGFKLESGPTGMTLSTEGKLEWKVPADFAEAPPHVIVSIRDKSGQEIFQTFQIQCD
jgi:hypothetical protein